MKIIPLICGFLCLLPSLGCLIWFAWLHYKGELIGDAPSGYD